VEIVQIFGIAVEFENKKAPVHNQCPSVDGRCGNRDLASRGPATGRYRVSRLPLETSTAGLGFRRRVGRRRSRGRRCNQALFPRSRAISCAIGNLSRSRQKWQREVTAVLGVGRATVHRRP